MADSIESFTPWLIRRSEREFISHIVGYAQDMMDEINLLEKEVDCLIGNDYNACLLSMKNILDKSNDAVKLRKTLVRKLEQSTITPDHRGYLANLIYSLSDIGGYVDSASARLSLKEVEINQVLRKGMLEMITKTSKMMMLLKVSIELLNLNLEKCLEHIENINNLEEEIDLVRRDLLRRIVNDDSIKSPQDMHVLIEIISSIENLSDKIDQAANRVEVIAMTHLP